MSRIMGVFTGSVNGSTAANFIPTGAGFAKWMIEFDRAAQTGNVAVTYKPAGFTNAVIPANNSVDIAANQVIWIQAPINAGQIVITPASVSAALPYRATAYMD